MNVCRICNESLEGKRSDARTCSDGCRRRLRYSLNKEEIKAKSIEYYNNNKERCSQTSKVWRGKNKEYLQEYEYNRSQQPHRKEIAHRCYKNRYNSRKDEILAKNKEWADNNPDKQYNRTKRWRQNNKQLVTSYTMKYKAKKIQATLEVCDSELKEIYKNCPEGYEVDHYFPLQSKEVCGLHIPSNLQYLTVEENRKKGNKMPNKEIKQIIVEEL